MTDKEAILKQVQDLPDAFLGELADFIRFLKMRATEGKLETALLSEPSLGKDWASAEEDEAWQDL